MLCWSGSYRDRVSYAGYQMIKPVCTLVVPTPVAVSAAARGQWSEMIYPDLW